MGRIWKSVGWCIRCGYPILRGKCDCSSGVPSPEEGPTLEDIMFNNDEEAEREAR